MLFISLVAQDLTQNITFKLNEIYFYNIKEHAPATAVQFSTTSLIVPTTNILKILYCIGNKSFDPYTYDINSIQENTNIIDLAKNWNTLLIKESLQIKLKKAVLNNGLKASKDLQLFN